jgi:hypothetical protein
VLARCRVPGLSTNVVLAPGEAEGEEVITMSEMSAGLRVLEMHERQAWHRERAHREQSGTVLDHEPRRLSWRRVVRRAA